MKRAPGAELLTSELDAMRASSPPAEVEADDVGHAHARMHARVQLSRAAIQAWRERGSRDHDAGAVLSRVEGLLR